MTGDGMSLKQLKEILSRLDGDVEVFVADEDVPEEYSVLRRVLTVHEENESFIVLSP